MFLLQLAQKIQGTFWRLLPFESNNSLPCPVQCERADTYTWQIEPYRRRDNEDFNSNGNFEHVPLWNENHNHSRNDGSSDEM